MMNTNFTSYKPLNMNSGGISPSAIFCVTGVLSTSKSTELFCCLRETLCHTLSFRLETKDDMDLPESPGKERVRTLFLFSFFPLYFFKKRNAPRTVHVCHYPYVTFFHSILPSSPLGLNWLSLESLIEPFKY